MIRSCLAILLTMAPLAAQADRVEQAAAKIDGGLDAADAEALVRELERAVGIDPGGWSMASQPLFHPSPEREAGTRAIGPKLKAALAEDSSAGVEAAVAEWLVVLSDQAGLPDGHRPGAKPGPLSLDEAAASLVEKCTDGTRVELRVQPNQLASFADWLGRRDL